jgi:hypothetical protein
MLTLFTTAKPFTGHSAVIQRNALESWKRLHPDVEVILFGDEEGAAEVCRELGLRHEAEMERSRLGAPRADFLFRRSQEIARHDLLCYSNCDIIFTQDFRQALERLLPWRNTFLMVGCRWDTDITEPIDFSDPAWETSILARARNEGYQRFYYNIDYFAFKRGLYREMPGLVVGRAAWDHWMVWNALAQKAPVVDATKVVCAVHQNHDYSSHPQGMLGTWHDEDAQRNQEFLRGHTHTIQDATFRLTATGIRPNRFHWLAPVKRQVRHARTAVRAFLRSRLWHPFLDKTRPLRQALGLRQHVLNPLRRRNRPRRHWLDQ